GDGFNTPHACGYAAFVDDLEQADVAGPPDVSAAAQLFAEIRDIDDSYLIAVFLPEQRHRARADGLVEGHDFGLDLSVAKDLLINEPLNFLDLGFVQRRIMREIETETRWLDDAACLLHMRAQRLAQGCVQQVRGRMVALRRESQRVLDLRAHLVTEPDVAGG